MWHSPSAFSNFSLDERRDEDYVRGGRDYELIDVENLHLTNEYAKKTNAHTQIENTHCCTPIRVLEVMGMFDWLRYSSRHCPMV